MLVGHEVDSVGAGGAPSLLASALAEDRTTLGALLEQGGLEERGVPKFADLTDEEVEAIH